MRIPHHFILLLGFCLFSLPALNDAVVADDAAPVKVRLQAAIVEGAKPLKDDIKWSIVPLSKGGTAAQEVTKASPDVRLAPGKYRVTATLGLATVSRDIAVAEAGKQELVFDAGWVHVQMVLSRKAQPIKDNVHWTIYRFTAGGVDEKAKLSELTAPSAQLILPKGWYMVRAKYQGIASELAAEVKAGTLYNYTIVAYAGKLTFAVVDAKGKVVKKGVLWSIERVSKANGGKRVPVVTDSAASQSLLLGEGKYVVVVKAGDRTGEVPFDIKATRDTKLTVMLKPH